MQKVSKEQLIKVLENSNADTIEVTFTKSVKMNKKNNPFFHKSGRSFVQDNDVTKRVTSVYGFGKNYAEEVNKAIRDCSTGEPALFEAKAVNWAETVVKDKVIRHKELGTLYLKVFVEKENKPAETYYVDGVEANDEQMRIINENEQRNYGSIKTQENAGLEQPNQILTITINMDGIEHVSIDGEVYELA